MIRSAGGRARLLACLLLGPSLAAGAAPPAPGGGPLLEAAEGGEATVLGTVGAVSRLDPRAHAAPLQVRQVLAGTVRAGSALRIAWEEISARRPVRFREGDRVLVVLEPLPGGSLWRSRFPDGRARAVAARGNAFLREPDGATVESLAAYLSVAPAERTGPRGARRLLDVAARADAIVAASALLRLKAIHDLDAKLDAPAVSRFATLLAKPDRPRSLRLQALTLAAERRLRAVREAIAPLAAPGSELEPEALAALARIDGGLPRSRAGPLLERPEAAVRAAVARYGGDGVADARRVALMKADPAPEVRAAAVESLVRRRGSSALDDAVPLLFDPDEGVRRSAGAGVGSMGGAAVPRLRKLLEQRPFEEPSELAGVVLALSLAGPDGQGALRDVHRSHPDERIRKLAGLGLGILPGDAH